MLRIGLGVIAGAIVSMLVVSVIEMAGFAMFPPPAGLDMNDPKAVATYVESVPPVALTPVLAAWTLGALAGAVVALMIARRKAVAGVIVGILVFAATIYSIVVIPSPVWFIVAALILVPAATIAAVFMLGSRAAKA